MLVPAIQRGNGNDAQSDGWAVDADTGKLTHSGAAQLAGSDYSLADYNRAGVPLLEIVSEPDLRTGAEAAAYGAEIRRIVRFIGAGNGNMQVCCRLQTRTHVHILIHPGEKAEAAGFRGHVWAAILLCLRIK